MLFTSRVRKCDMHPHLKPSSSQKVEEETWIEAQLIPREQTGYPVTRLAWQRIGAGTPPTVCVAASPVGVIRTLIEFHTERAQMIHGDTVDLKYQIHQKLQSYSADSCVCSTTRSFQYFYCLCLLLVIKPDSKVMQMWHNHQQGPTSRAPPNEPFTAQDGCLNHLTPHCPPGTWWQIQFLEPLGAWEMLSPQ